MHMRRQVKMVGILILNVEPCEGFARVRSFSGSGEAASAEKTALHAALREKRVGGRGSDGCWRGRGGARVSVRPGGGGGRYPGARLPHSRLAGFQVASAGTPRSAGAAHSGTCRC